jgi:pimeloyl-ACP methyl ester carboxylesterase
MTARSNNSVSRRTALAGLGAGALAATLGLGGHVGRVAAQEATPSAQAATPTAEGEFATVNGAELYYEVHGPAAGPPVLLLHGSIGNTGDFVNVVPALAVAGYRAVAFDARGRGRSTWGDLPITFDQMTADAVGMLDHLGIRQAHVVGWSQGGEVALSLAIHHPERLGRVVAYGATFAPEGHYPDAPHPSDQLPSLEKFAAEYQLLSPQPERFQELFAVEPAQFSEAELRSITVPVLVLDGAAEEFIKPEHTRRLAELIPGAQLVIMPGTGHFAPFARPDEFNRIVLAFLAGEAVGTPTAATPSA